MREGSRYRREVPDLAGALGNRNAACARTACAETAHAVFGTTLMDGAN